MSRVVRCETETNRVSRRSCARGTTLWDRQSNRLSNRVSERATHASIPAWCEHHKAAQAEPRGCVGALLKSARITPSLHMAERKGL